MTDSHTDRCACMNMSGLLSASILKCPQSELNQNSERFTVDYYTIVNVCITADAHDPPRAHLKSITKITLVQLVGTHARTHTHMHVRARAHAHANTQPLQSSTGYFTRCITRGQVLWKESYKLIQFLFRNTR